MVISLERGAVEAAGHVIVARCFHCVFSWFY